MYACISFFQVTKIDYSGSKVSIYNTDGAIMTCDACVITVPLKCLQNEMIEMVPELPSDKLSAIHLLGAGIIEKVLYHLTFNLYIICTLGYSNVGPHLCKILYKEKYMLCSLLIFI